MVYLYLQELQGKQESASAADSLVGALGFCWGTCGLSVNLSTLKSARVVGLAHLQLKQRKPVRRAEPLTASQVCWLEQLAAGPPDQYETLVAAGLCFALFARARNSELLRSQDIQFDWSSDCQAGFVECQVLNPKQAKASNKGNRLLPLVAPVQGLRKESWAKPLAWQRQDRSRILP